MNAVLNEVPYHNAVTRAVYSPNNAQILHETAILCGYDCKAVAGFKQWLEVGRVVRKGEHGTKIYMMVDKKDEAPNKEGETEKHKVLKMRTVFFESQTIPLDGEPTEPEAPKPTAPALSIVPTKSTKVAKPASIGPKLLAMAEGMQSKIDHAFSNRLENTPKRRREAASARLEGYRLKRTQTALTRLAGLYEAGNVPVDLFGITTKAKVYELVATILDTSHCGYYDAPVDTGKPRYTTPEAVALWALLDDSGEEAKAEALRRQIAAVRQSGIPGFFPTPPVVVEMMISRAESRATFWENFLEPSAGDGSIASALIKRYPDIKLSLCEVNHTLTGILQARGFAVDQTDFLRVEPSPEFDCILMNPPFEGLADIDHVRHAYNFLRPGGVLVSVMSPGPFFRTGAKAEDFRAWLESVGGESEDLPDGSFLPSGTGVATKLVTIQR